MLRALTLIRPWTDAIVHSTKRIENRTWPPPKSVIGTVIALHAGRGYDEIDLSRWPKSLDWKPPSKALSAEGIVGLARVVRAVHEPDPIYRETLPEGLPIDQMKWWCGPIGWLLDDVRALPKPVPCKGSLSVWLVPEPVELAVRSQLR